MKFKNLEMTGFKSFSEKTTVLIEKGLTGIVGPNGCGKSNIVEALRWCMGENSAKSMRGSGMEDVIFSGTSNRPSKNISEVSLIIDNQEKNGPIQYKEFDEISIKRKIEKDKGSKYYINDKEVRARDVQTFFADLSTGAHSPSLISQGRIGQLVIAKPIERKSILEEAARARVSIQCNPPMVHSVGSMPWRLQVPGSSFPQGLPNQAAPVLPALMRTAPSPVSSSNKP